MVSAAGSRKRCPSGRVDRKRSDPDRKLSVQDLVAGSSGVCHPRHALAGELRSRVRVATERARATARSATHAEAKQENDKDTRALEETYLAAGQAQRVAELELDLVEIRSLGTRPPSDFSILLVCV